MAVNTTRSILMILLIFAMVLSPTLPCDAAPPSPRFMMNPGYISIDCGADEDYFDEETGIFYKSDRDFISSGENHEVLPQFVNDNYPYLGRQLKNLRSFPTGKKNCYTLQPEQGKNNNYFIRIFFKYGNYDSQNQIPEFVLYLGVYHWATVQLSSPSDFFYYEIIYFSLTDIIYVCLVNTGSGIPFITTLELRLLNDSIYRSVESNSLRPIRHVDLGNQINTLARYKDDIYDRVWMSSNLSSSVPISDTSITNFLSSSESYDLPAEVLRNAAQPQSNLSSLSYSLPVLYSSTKYHVYFHFAEIVRNPQGLLREFIITVNGVNYGPYTLEYLTPLTVTLATLPIQGYINFSIISTLQSDLPPILNAFEILRENQLKGSPTAPTDVVAIMAIKRTYSLDREDWQGDPCVPEAYSWNGLNCSSYSNSPRIISLNLSSSKLTGKIDSSFSNLTAIKSLDLSYNELTGPVPDFLSQLSNLTILNLSGNKLTGSVPQSLIEKSTNGILQLSLDGNPNLCLTDSCGKKKQSFLIPVIGSIISILVLLLFSIVAILWRKKRLQGERITEPKKESSLKSKNRPFTYPELVSITKNFREIIGEGGFGKVYLGNLDDGSPVAVKLLSKSSVQGYKEFQSEVQLLMIVHHRNLVSLIGYCDEKDNMALVYEYMENGNLRQHLSETRNNVLSWTERLQIAVDAAHGLEYLHNGCKPPIVHRDLKPSNILLNENMQAKIADFGLSKAFATDTDSHVTTRPAGTPGYLDPEFRLSGKLNKNSDVYSFGVLLLELITGQTAITRTHDECSTHIRQWVGHSIKNGDIQSIVDPWLEGEFNINSAWKAVEIAMSCVPPAAIQRPDMSHVLAELKECLAMVVPCGRTQNNSFEISSLELNMESGPIAR